MILDKNAFIAVLLPKFIIRTLTPIERDAYRLPFVEPDSRWPTSIWPRELPIGGEPVDVVKVMEDYGNGSCGPPLPKLLINAEPGSMLIDGHANSVAPGQTRRR